MNLSGRDARGGEFQLVVPWQEAGPNWLVAGSGGVKRDAAAPA